jgi:class 3 adenylate cyclase
LPPVNTSFVASVVFLRIQDFANRPASEQARLRAQLEAVVAVTTAELRPASRIVLDASDGVAIVVLCDPKGALRLAERALAAHVAGLPLCAGVNHGAVRLLADSAGEAMVGDGIAVAASVVQFAPPSELRITRAFRDALADAAPGLEASLVPKGSSKDASLRSHELFTRERTELQRRSRTYAALSVVAVVALLATGLGWRISEQGQKAFVDGLAAKYRATTVQGERYVRGLVQKVKFQ